MSANSLSKKPLLPKLKVSKIAKSFSGARGWKWLFIFPAWVALAYIFSNLLLVLGSIILGMFDRSYSDFANPAVVNAVLSIVVYALSITIVVAVPYALKTRYKTTVQELGLQRLIYWSDIGLAPVFFIGYVMASQIVLAVVTSVLPAFPLDQAQDVGFKAFGSTTDNIIAFATLVVLAPIAEETLFRGYLYGKLRTYAPVVYLGKKAGRLHKWTSENSPAILAAIATSVLFGLAHLQWNVGIDVFILSLFLCALRSITGSIWAGVLVHMIKNGLAFYIMFVAPLTGLGG